MVEKAVIFDPIGLQFMQYIHRDSGLIVNVKRIRYTETYSDQFGNKTEIETQTSLETESGQKCFIVNGDIVELDVLTPLGNARVVVLDPTRVAFP